MNVVVFLPANNPHQNSTLWEFLSLLSSSGQEVTLVCLASDGKIPVPKGVGLKARGRFFQRFYWYTLLKVPKAFVLRLFFSIVHFFSLRNPADVVVGVDREGVIEGAEFARRHSSPLFFLSFEIMFASETSDDFKRPEILACERVSKAFVQDPARARLLIQENRIAADRIRLVPMGPRGDALSHSGPSVREKLCIPPSKKVALFMGTISGWSGFSSIAASVTTWPKDWVLLVHSRDGLNAEREAALVVGEVEDRVYFTKGPFEEMDQLGALLTGIDVGLAFYFPDWASRFTGRNLQEIGLASGKIADFLRHGVPVITNVEKPYGYLLKEHDCGEVVSELKSLGESLAVNDFEKMRIASKRLFSKVFDFALYEKEVLKDLGFPIARYFRPGSVGLEPLK